MFEESESYRISDLSNAFLRDFLGDKRHIVLSALSEHNEVVGGLVAYELKKFEKDRSEIFVYDLAVSESHR